MRLPQKTKDTLTSIGLLVLRAGMGGYMLTHGWGKVRMILDGNHTFVGDPIGIGAALSTYLLVFAEFVCAGLIVIGLLTRAAAVPLVFAMCVAAFVAHGKDPWTMGEAYRLFTEGKTQFPASKQPALIYAIAFLALVFTGPGRISLDALIWNRGRAGEG